MNNLIKSNTDDLVDSITCYNPKPLWLHYYIGPFVAIYSFLIYLWFGNENLANRDQLKATNSNQAISNQTSSEPIIGNQTSTNEPSISLELWIVYVAIAIFSQVLLFLSCQWSIHINCLLAFKQAKSPENAVYVKVVPTKNNGSTELRSLNKKLNKDGQQLDIWFYFQKTKFSFDQQTGLFSQIQFPVNETIQHYLNSKGFQDQTQFEQAETKYGKNDVEMIIPEFIELFKERAIAPFFVFQVFCVLLWCLDEYWYYSLFTLFLLISFECILVKQQLRNLTEIRKMGKKPYNVFVYRFKKWQSISSDELLPGDLINITRSHNDNHVPCDILLLKGSCIVDESMLTGESVPQMKEGIDGVKDLADHLSVSDSDSKLHVIFGGTKILQHTAPQKGISTVNTIKPMDSGCLGYVMRTSFNTAQGKLLRTILFGVKRVTENNLETFCFILFLLIFAIAAASYLWIEGNKDPNRNRYKLFLECTLILTSVVPPELPIELSLAVNTSLLSLVKLFIFCTEPFRIPFAGKIEICCFDKTGTLTSDNLIIEGVAATPNSKDLKKINQSSELPIETVQVMATCHSLVQLDDELVGDPLEKATLEAVDYSVMKNDVVLPKKGRQAAIKIVQRFHFSSQLKRMSVLSSLNLSSTNETQFIATVKGAPETLKPMFEEAPKEYDEIYLDLSRRGARVIALGRKVLGNNLSLQEVKEMKRDDVEKDLEFVGFAVITTPLKPDSRALIKEIMDSSHRVTMITGDAPLTACYVAKELNFMKRKRSLILSKNESEKDCKPNEEYKWRTIDLDLSLQVEPTNVKEFLSKYDLCLTGDSMSYLIEQNFKLFKSILPFVKVWARVAPKQKEFIITSMRNQGYYVLMCGDGTNDVGALKHAHTGIALIANAPLTAPKRSATLGNRPSLSQLQSSASQLDGNARRQGLNDLTNSPAFNSSNTISNSNQIRPRQQFGLNRRPPQAAAQTNSQTRMAELQRMIDQINEEEKAQMVKLGDASIAAPFTSKLSSIKCVCDIIKQGRCTLVTTLQMFKILALNALILAYCQSVLYLDGVRMNDSQATIQSLLISGCFLFISRSNPLKTLSKERPLPDIFNAYTILTVISQFIVHFSCLLFLVKEAKLRSPQTEGPIIVDEKKPFEPNLLNSSIYIISICFQINTFAVNYKGHPFMERIQDNKPFLWSILITVCVLIGVVTNTAPGLTEQLSLVKFEGEFQNILMITLLVDFFGAFLVDRFWLWLMGKGKLRKELEI